MCIMEMQLSLRLIQPPNIIARFSQPSSLHHSLPHRQNHSHNSHKHPKFPPLTPDPIVATKYKALDPIVATKYKALANDKSLGCANATNVSQLSYGSVSLLRPLAHRRRPLGKKCVAPLLALSSSAVGPAAATEEDGEALEKKNGYGRPVVILPGLGNNSGDYDDIVGKLTGLGLAPTVAQVSRPDWLRNALGLLDGAYWRGTLRPRPVLDWYLERISNAIAAAKSGTAESRKVALVGHSAGGWLARVFMAEFGTDDIDLLLTLGTPHLPPPRGLPGVIDQTRGLLYHVEENCPGAYHPEVKYVTVAGRYMKGERLFGAAPAVSVTGLGTVASPSAVGTVVGMEGGGEGGGVAELESPPLSGEASTSKLSFRAWVIGQGYKQVCGDAIVWGDGVVPEAAAHLDGAINITIDGVYHSPVGAQDDGRPWYGSSGILDKWVDHLLD